MKLNEQRHPHLTALEKFEDLLRETFDSTNVSMLRPRPDLLQIIDADGDTFIAAVPVPSPPGDVSGEPKPICMMTMTSVLKGQPRLTDEQINECNRFAGLSLLTRQHATPQVMAASSFALYDDAAQQSKMRYIGMQAVVLQRPWLSTVLAALENDFRQDFDKSYPMASAPSRWSSQELASLAKDLEVAGYKVRVADPNNLIMYLNKSNSGAPNSFLIVTNDYEHPCYGNGLSVSLVLPEEKGVTKEQFDNRCLDWNRRESITILSVPCIGAWSTVIYKPDPPGGDAATVAPKIQLSYRVFVPNMCYVAGLGKLAIESAIHRWAVCGDLNLREI
jgi:hypothetical protein